MAKRVSRTDDGVTAAPPLPFDPGGFYTDDELATKLKVSSRTIKRWRSKGAAEPTIEFSTRTKRTLGRVANAMWQSRLKATA